MQTMMNLWEWMMQTMMNLIVVKILLNALQGIFTTPIQKIFKACGISAEDVSVIAICNQSSMQTGSGGSQLQNSYNSTTLGILRAILGSTITAMAFLQSQGLESPDMTRIPHALFMVSTNKDYTS